MLIHGYRNSSQYYFVIITGYCKQLKLDFPKHAYAALFTELQLGRKPSNLSGKYKYQLTFDGKPAYKHTNREEIYMYWSPKNQEWMVMVFIYKSRLTMFTIGIGYIIIDHDDTYKSSNILGRWWHLE